MFSTRVAAGRVEVELGEGRRRGRRQRRGRVRVRGAARETRDPATPHRPGLPVDRPPLTKAALADGRLRLLADEERLAERGIDLLDGMVAEADLASGRLRAEGAAGTTEIEAETVVLATGLRYPPPPIPGIDAALVNADPATLERIAAALAGGPRRVVVIGAGLIGTESAATLAAAGHDVTVLDVLDRPLDRLHEPLPALGAAALAATGARFLGGAEITELRREGGQRHDLSPGRFRHRGPRPRGNGRPAARPAGARGRRRRAAARGGRRAAGPRLRAGARRRRPRRRAARPVRADPVPALGHGDRDRRARRRRDRRCRGRARPPAVLVDGHRRADLRRGGMGRGGGGVERGGRHPRRPRRRGRGRRRARRRRAAAAPRGPLAARVLIPRDEHGVRASVAAPRRDARGGSERAAAIVAGAWQSFDQARPGQPGVDERLQRLLRAALPEEGSSALGALDDAAEILDLSIAQPRPRYFAFVGSSGLEIGVLGDLLAACFDVNLAVWAGAATGSRTRPCAGLSEFFGYPAAAGAFTSGGTISNVTALAAARERALPGSRTDGHRRRAACALYCSAEAHYSVVRAAELLGIGSDLVRALPHDERRRLRPDAVAAAIDGDRAAGIAPIAVVATAGTTLTGAVDPIDALADVCEAARRLAPRRRGLRRCRRRPHRPPGTSSRARARRLGDAGRPQVAVPPQGMRRRARSPPRGDLDGALAHEEDYIPHERPEHHMVDITLEYSRPFRALKLWLAFRAHGAAAIRAAIERNLGQARLLHAEISATPRARGRCAASRRSPSSRSATCPEGSPTSTSTTRASRRRSRSRATSGSLRRVSTGRSCLRPCFVNYRTSDDDVRALVDATLEVGTQLAR